MGPCERVGTGPESGAGALRSDGSRPMGNDGRAEHGIDPDPYFRRRSSMIIIVAATDEVRGTRADREIHTLERTAQ